MSKPDGEKDFWDRLDVFAKVVGSILVPSVVAGSVYFWNAERTEQATRTQMIEIAIGILSAETTQALGLGEKDPLREWAVDVLESPRDPPPISQAASIALRTGSRIQNRLFDPEVRARQDETMKRMIELLNAD